MENSEFQKESMKIFAHAYTDDAMQPLRELFANTRKVLLFKLNTGGAKASNAYAEAKYSGSRGNAIRILIEKNEAFVETENEVYNVSTYLDTSLVDTQKSVKSSAELKENAFVRFKTDAALAEIAATPLTGGTNGAVENAAYQTYLDKIEPHTFHAMGCASTNEIIKGLFATFTKRMRDIRCAQIRKHEA